MNLTWDQEMVVNAKEKRILVSAAPATGKSTTAAARVKKMIEDGYSPFNIVILSYTNAGAEAIAAKVDNPNIFVGTLHSYCCSFLTKAGISVAKYLSTQKFDKIFDEVIKHPEVVPIGKYIILDEAQDTSQMQIDLILKYLRPDGFMFFGDPNQCIYSYDDADLLNVFPRLEDDPTITTYHLYSNFRNSKAINQYARKLLAKVDREDESDLMREEKGIVLKTDNTKANILEIIRENEDNLSDIFVLCMTNQEVLDTAAFLNKEGYRAVEFSSLGSSSEEFANRMKEDAIKVLTYHKSKGLETDIVLLLNPITGARASEDRILVTYVGATRARDKLYVLKRPKKTKNKYAF